MQGLPLFNESFDTNPPQPFEKTLKDGAFHVNVLNARKGNSPVIMQMYNDTKPKFKTFSTSVTLYKVRFKDLKIMNEAFDVLEKSIKARFLSDRRKIILLYPSVTSAYKALYWINISKMFNVGIAAKLGNIDRFILNMEDKPDLAQLRIGLIAFKKTITDKMDEKSILNSYVDSLEKDARAKQKIFCIEEQGNAGLLMNEYKATPYFCNQFYLVTDIKHYKPTEAAIAKKEAHLHSFLPNTITIVSDILLSPSCALHIKNLGLETVKIGTTFLPTVKPAQKNSLDPGKTFKKKIKFIGDESNTLLVVDTTGNTETVTLEIIVKNVTVKDK